VRERLGHAVYLVGGIAQGLADLAYGAARAVRVDHGHARAPVPPVALQDHVVDLLAPRGLHVDVYVGQVLAEGIHEPLEHQAVVDGVDLGDTGQVADQRARSRPSRGHADAHAPYLVGDVGDGQEERRVPHVADLGELEVQAVEDLPLPRHPVTCDPAVATLREERCGAAPGRRREVREVRAAQCQVERARLGDPHGVVA
jgi:hypothetical protein